MLDLRFSTRAGRIEISSDLESTGRLNALRSRFASSASMSRQAFDLDIDDLLVNLHELAQWPSTDSDIRWQPELLALVEGNAADGLIVLSRLASPDGEGPGRHLDLDDSWSAHL